MNIKKACLSLMVSLTMMLCASWIFLKEPHYAQLPDVPRKPPVPVAKKPEKVLRIQPRDIPAAPPVAAKPHFTVDPDWRKVYEKGGDRDVVFAADATKPGFKRKWTNFSGPEYIDSAELEKVVRIAMKRLPHVPQKDEIVKLVVETSVAESMSGRHVSSRGGDHGVFQIRVEVANELLSWLRVRRKDVHDAVMLFHDPKKDMAQNLDSNIPFGAVVAICEYWRKAGADFHEKIDTIRDRAIMWKSVYNTTKGKGTVADYERRVAEWKRVSKDGVEKLNEKLAAAQKGASLVAQK